MIEQFKSRLEQLLNEKYDITWRSERHAEVRGFSYKTLRRMVSREHGLPRYKVFMDFLSCYEFKDTPAGRELSVLYNESLEERHAQKRRDRPDTAIHAETREHGSTRIHRSPKSSQWQRTSVPSVEDCLRQNELVWGEWTEINLHSEEYPVSKLISGEIDTTLMPLEIAELGDVRGKTMLHLQCHFGLDSISWARRGADVTGVDFDNRAIMRARQIASQMNILNVRFIRSDVMKLRESLSDTKFDIVFTSYGVLPWLPSIRDWAENSAYFVRPGGTLYIAEFHPFAHVFDNSDDVRGLYAQRSYFNREARALRIGPYVKRNDPTSDQLLAYQWHHTLGDVVCSVIESGLMIKHLHEFPFTTWMHFPFVQRDETGWRHLPPPLPEIPLLFSLLAVKAE